MFGNVLKPWHLAVLVAVLILLFGAKRLPDAARSLGRSMRILKAETKGLVDDGNPDDLADKADAQAARQPLKDGQSQGKAATGEVIDPVERVRDK